MELVEIREYKVGQIVNNILITNDIYKNITISNNLKIPNELKINGFIGITHKLEENKLVEIEREEFEVGDIVEIDYSTKYVLCETDSVYSDEIDGYKLYNFFSGLQYITIRESDLVYKKHNIKKIGIYDVNFEFKNRNLINKE